MSEGPIICVSAGRESTQALVANGPRRDFLEISASVDGRLLWRDDATLVSRSWLKRYLGPHVRQAWQAAGRAKKGETIFADGEHIGLPLLFFAAVRRKQARVVMIGHFPAKPWKRVLFWAGTRLTKGGLVIIHSTVQKAHLERWLDKSWKTVLLPYQVDTHYWRCQATQPENLVVAVGAENRDYATLVAAAAELPDIRFVVAAGSRWARSGHSLANCPANVEFLGEPLEFDALRRLYERALAVVVPLADVANQSGITTLLEAMAMGKPVVVTATEGQRECVNGPLVNQSGRFDSDATADRGPHLFGLTPTDDCGLYVPVGDSAALAAAVRLLVSNPWLVREIGAAARNSAEANFGLRRFVASMSSAIGGDESTRHPAAIVKAPA